MEHNMMESAAMTRRRMLQAAAGAGVALALGGCGSARMQAQGRRNAPAALVSTSVPTLDLTGDAWTMHADGRI